MTPLRRNINNKLGGAAAVVAKIGLSASTSHFRRSPSYLWFCSSCIQFNWFSSRSTRVFCSLRDRIPESAARKISCSADSIEANPRSNCGISQLYKQYNESQMWNKQGSSFRYSRETHSFRGERIGEDNKEFSSESNFLSLGHLAVDWCNATKKVKENKTVYCRTLLEEHIEKIDEPGRTDIVCSSKRNLENVQGAHVSCQQTLPDKTRHTRLSMRNDAYSNVSEEKGCLDSVADKASLANKKPSSNENVGETLIEKISSSKNVELRERLSRVYNQVLVVDNINTAREVVNMLTDKYKSFIHACDTEVSNINVKEETPVDHGEVICFSIYSGPGADFGGGKSCVWVDILDGGGKDLLKEFAPFFEDPSIKKVWHNYSFNNHVIENYGIKLSGFYADTMHMARLWNSSRRSEGGYSLEALSVDSRVMSDAKMGPGEIVVGKVSMKNIFGRKKLRKDGSEGKILVIPSTEELQRNEKKLWICYSALDSISTLKLYQSLERKLLKMYWIIEGEHEGSMFDNYQHYVRPFGELLVKMESEGMLIDRAYLAEVEKVAKVEQQVAADRFRNWASKYCPDAKYMNVGSDVQLRLLFFGGTQNSKDPNQFLPVSKDFTVPNVDNIIEEGKKKASRFRKIVLRKFDGVNMEINKYTPTGWPSINGEALKIFAGKVSADFEFLDEENTDELNEVETDISCEGNEVSESVYTDTSDNGTAYSAFGGGQAGIKACHAIAALCEVCSIDSLISNFILPLQSNHIAGKNGRIHCSLNINTETGRLSARRPNLQNQPALEKDRYKIRQAFIAAPGNSLIVADYGQLELRILAHLANCKSMLEAFEAGGDFHWRTAMNMYPHIRKAVDNKDVLLEWHPRPGEDKPPVPLLKDAFASERRKAKMLNFSIAYGKTTVGLARDWNVSRKEAQETVDLWYSDRKEVLSWQVDRKSEARKCRRVYTLLGRARHFPSLDNCSSAHRAHIERAAINTPVQGSAADVAMCAMLQISKNERLKELGWRLVIQIHDEVILEGPTESAEEAKSIVVDCMSKPFDGKNILRVGLSVDAKYAQNWYSAK